MPIRGGTAAADPQPAGLLRPGSIQSRDVFFVTERVAVIYLARVPDGIDVFKRFADSYRKCDAGHPHELILLCKGLKKRGERAYIEEIFKGVSYRIIAISDEGFDINAYLKVSAELDHEFLMFCNTHSEILAEDWLKKMMAYATAPDVGFVGATASYESIAISQKLFSKILWLTSNKRFPFDPELYSYYAFFLNITRRSGCGGKN
jgi:hypothetical protein